MGSSGPLILIIIMIAAIGIYVFGKDTFLKDLLKGGGFSGPKPMPAAQYAGYGTY